MHYLLRIKGVCSDACFFQICVCLTNKKRSSEWKVMSFHEKSHGLVYVVV